METGRAGPSDRNGRGGSDALALDKECLKDYEKDYGKRAATIKLGPKIMKDQRPVAALHHAYRGFGAIT
jgi:hypothetical protein